HDVQQSEDDRHDLLDGAELLEAGLGPGEPPLRRVRPAEYSPLVQEDLHRQVLCLDLVDVCELRLVEPAVVLQQEPPAAGDGDPGDADGDGQQHGVRRGPAQTTTATRVVFTVRKNAFATARRADTLSAISTASLYASMTRGSGSDVTSRRRRAASGSPKSTCRACRRAWPW